MKQLLRRHSRLLVTAVVWSESGILERTKLFTHSPEDSTRFSVTSAAATATSQMNSPFKTVTTQRMKLAAIEHGSSKITHQSSPSNTSLMSSQMLLSVLSTAMPRLRFFFSYPTTHLICLLLQLRNISIASRISPGKERPMQQW